jgi:hypothetical protein
VNTIAEKMQVQPGHLRSLAEKRVSLRTIGSENPRGRHVGMVFLGRNDRADSRPSLIRLRGHGVGVRKMLDGDPNCPELDPACSEESRDELKVFQLIPRFAPPTTQALANLLEA